VNESVLKALYNGAAKGGLSMPGLELSKLSRYSLEFRPEFPEMSSW
jgi:hypothetical protein